MSYGESEINSQRNAAKHPPFYATTQRFAKAGTVPKPEGPGYHVAYRDVMQPARRTTKGWSSIDDSIKSRRGTGAGMIHSSMAAAMQPNAPGSTLQPMYATHPNETRLQELLDLQRRKLGLGPGPGQYQVPDFPPTKTCFRRQAISQLDGPFIPPPSNFSVFTTRDRELETTMTHADSGLAPGTYESHLSKDVVMRQAPATKIGTGARSGHTIHTKSLSVSRAMQHGIDWHKPLVKEPGTQEESSEKKKEEDSDKKPSGAQSKPAPLSRLPAAAASPAPHAPDELLLPPPVGGKAPAPPPAVARSIRRVVEGAPGDWDWQKLGHNYRNNWTNLHGGAYSHGDRSSMRRDSKVDAVDYMGQHTESIDPRRLPQEAMGEIFPIPEEGSGFFQDINGRPHNHDHGMNNTAGSDDRGSMTPGEGAARGPASGSLSSALTTPTTTAVGQDLGAEADAAAGSSSPGAWEASRQVQGSLVSSPETTPPVPERFLTQAELIRRDAAQQAVMRAQEAAMRKAAWSMKASTPLKKT
ncbi:hypothetical protein CEUSTIGMA_g11257.t1 [Chlamydomonas eustigma]|uniref:Uncharacterized protein n=1 Tax=Chlamydomonas eustigma TaxID=1157962 RepID=A0A250XLD3_9CHLO|nr:hypothetical protein CEUSTIGMA_g11257.t1 [Chlamydomonas eustigma]|eukprot:GAX83833.1 hypothetical protein CEUSTIGMA_g11257.t1 [Chlamydomonas eustigma]